MPGADYYKPAGVPLRFLDEVCLSIEGMEAVRLKDLEDLDQEQGAERMNISRATFQRVLESARKKIADALINGKAIKIEGGAYELCSAKCTCKNGSVRSSEIHDRQNDNRAIRRKTNMKIAVVTDDELTISQHFGQASLYVVYTVQDGKITGKEKRPKMGHRHFAFKDERPHVHGELHGYDLASVNRHASMAVTIKDSQVLIAGGMGMAAYESMKSCKIEPIVTDVANIDEAVKLYLEGKLPNLMTRLH